MWFERLTGFTEQSAEQVQENLLVKGSTLLSNINGKKYQCGILETPSLAELRQRVQTANVPQTKSTVSEVISDAQSLHLDEFNAGAMFQVASQFNLLEMPSPRVTPESGVTAYESDMTQGPACAVACGAGTIFRNYFVEVNDRVGQSAENQIDCLSALGAEFDNHDERLWAMQNGYALATVGGLQEISDKLNSATAAQLDHYRGLLRIGLQWNTEVTLSGCSHLLSQVYGSALPVGYSPHTPDLWEPFARLVLEASYEATFAAAVLNSIKNDNNKLFLTLIGGGVFGNELAWITAAIERALNIYKDAGLDVMIVSYRYSKSEIQELCR